MEEYKILTGTAADCQKVLNQWRHDYTLRILQMSVESSPLTVVILLTRTEKEATDAYV